MHFPKTLELKTLEANLEEISLLCINKFPIYASFLSMHNTNIKKLCRHIVNYICCHFSLTVKLNNFIDLEKLCFEIGKRLYAKVIIKVQRSNYKGFHKNLAIQQLRSMPFFIYCIIEKQENNDNYKLKLSVEENCNKSKVNAYFENLMNKQRKEKENKLIEKELEKVGLELSSDSENEDNAEENNSNKYFLSHKEEDCESCHIDGASFEDFQNFLDEHSKENLQGLKDTILENYASLVKTTEIFMDFMHKITQSVEKIPVYYDDAKTKKWKISCSMCTMHCPRFYNSAQLRGAGRPPVRHKQQ